MNESLDPNKVVKGLMKKVIDDHSTLELDSTGQMKSKHREEVITNLRKKIEQ